jgi:elongation factor P
MDTVTNMKKGMIIKHEGGLFLVVQARHNWTGRGAGSMIAKLKNIETGINAEVKFRSDEKFEEVDLDEIPMEYLYQDGDQHCFMNNTTFEQILLGRDVLEEEVKYLVPNIQVRVKFYHERPIEVVLPNEVTLTVTDTGPNVKGSTATASTKPATCETGLVVQVPLFIETGEKIIVYTEEGTYISRAKDKKD